MRVARFSSVCIAAFAIACSDASGPGRGAPASLEIVSGNGQTAPVATALPAPILIRVRDDRGHPAPNAAVQVDAPTGGASVDNTSLVANDSGLVWVYWTLGTVAAKVQLVVRLAQGNTASITLNATAVAGPSATLRVTNSPLATTRNGDPIAQAPTVAVSDRFGNAAGVASIVVSAAVAPGVGKRSVRGTTSATTNDAGIATFTGLAVAGDSGTVTLVFSAPGLTGASATVVLTPGPPARIDAVTVAPVGGVIFDTGPPVQVRVVDESGNGLRGVDVHFAFATIAASATVQSDAAGLATFNGWIFPPAVGSYAIVASAAGLPDLSITVTAKPRPPSKLLPLTPASIAGNAGDAGADISVRAMDAAGGNVAGVTVTFALDGTKPKDVITDSEGIASLASWNLPAKPAAYRITASISGLPVVNFDLTVSVGPPTKLDVITFPINPTVSSSTQLTARVTDAAGNTIPRASVQWQALTSGVTVSPASTAADDAGVVGVTLTFSTVATTVKVRASLTGGAAIDFVYQVAPGPVVAFETPVVFLTLAVNTRFTISVRALDQWANPVPNTRIYSYVDYPSSYDPLVPVGLTTDANGRLSLSGLTGATPGLEQFYVYGGDRGAMALVRVTVF